MDLSGGKLTGFGAGGTERVSPASLLARHGPSSPQHVAALTSGMDERKMSGCCSALGVMAGAKKRCIDLWGLKALIRNFTTACEMLTSSTLIDANSTILVDISMARKQASRRLLHLCTVFPKAISSVLLSNLGSAHSDLSIQGSQGTHGLGSGSSCGLGA
nr:hypothetical protein [Tanacetum cinerariifolium]